MSTRRFHSSSICSEDRDSAMAYAKQPAKRKRRKTALPMLGAAGVSLTMAGGASAAVAPTANGPLHDPAPPPVFVLDEEEISDVSLATFYVFDRENQSLGERIQLAQRCGRGCGGTRLRRSPMRRRRPMRRSPMRRSPVRRRPMRRCAGGCRCAAVGVVRCGVGCGGCSCSCCLSWGCGPNPLC